MCGTITNALLVYLSLAVTAVLFVQIFYTGQVKDLDFDSISDIVTALELQDISRYPYPNDIVARPDLGECCNGLCSGETCYIGNGLTTLNPLHCNNCCRHLTAPASCVGSECLCYANEI